MLYYVPPKIFQMGLDKLPCTSRTVESDILGLCLQCFHWLHEPFGSSIKDVRPNLEIFWTPLPMSRHAHICLTTRPSPVRPNTRIALIKTLQLVSNSH